MSYEYKGRKGRRHPADIHAEQQAARAVSFCVIFSKGPCQRLREDTTNRAEAFAIAARLNAEHGQHGRRACVYGITPEGTSWPIAAS